MEEKKTYMNLSLGTAHLYKIYFTGTNTAYMVEWVTHISKITAEAETISLLPTLLSTLCTTLKNKDWKRQKIQL